ncbi:serine--tRNA ligase [Candidatus Dependentiae bacterium]|nr:serine--tRNA ligase [Candidatus Dependentiae bacterium]
MIDLGRLRREPELVIGLLKKKDPSFDGERLKLLDEEVRKLKIEVDTLRSKKNELARSAGREGVSDTIREQAKKLHEELENQERTLETVLEEFNTLYLWCPNIIMDSVPEGTKDDNVVVKVYGEKPSFSFAPKNHVELGALNGWFDFEAASKMTGSNFALYKGEAVKLVYKLMLFMWNNNTKHGYEPFLPPYLVNEKALEGSSNFPRFKDEVYHIEDQNLYLTPTAEVNLTSLHSNRIFMTSDLPQRMTAWTSCFRKEAGTYGAAERGLIRIHQFEKVELYTLCEPSHAQEEQDRMVACAESLLQELGLHYRISLLASQDCSFASAKTYDIEVWMPGQGVYKEVSSASNCTDFQARRSDIRYKESAGEKAHYVSTLNASSLALPRLLVALMETYQQPDGSIKLPSVLDAITLR